MAGEPWHQGMTLDERVAERERLTEWYADRGHDEDHEMRKLAGPGCASDGPHSPCGREDPGGPGCPCVCHDPRADEIAELTQQLRQQEGAR